MADSNGYLRPGEDPDELVFKDYPMKEKYESRVELVPCPVCKGHGGWNLKPDSYKLRPGVEDTPENRHRMSHFRAYCNQCKGYGWVGKDSVNATCIHEMEWVQKLGNCHNLYKCKKCGRIDHVDSSD